MEKSMPVKRLTEQMDNRKQGKKWLAALPKRSHGTGEKRAEKESNTKYYYIVLVV